MSNQSGIFSLSIQSAQWQLKHLFDEVGGEHAVSALDELSTLPKGVQVNLLQAFARVIKEVKSGALKLQGNEEPVSEIEQSLLNEIAEDLGKARFAVIDGGKSVSREKVIAFPVARRVSVCCDDKLLA